MTVAELIAKLQEMPQDMEVVAYDPDNGWQSIDFVQLIPWRTGAQVQVGHMDMQGTIDALNEPDTEKFRQWRDAVEKALRS